MISGGATIAKIKSSNYFILTKTLSESTRLIITVFESEPPVLITADFSCEPLKDIPAVIIS